MSTTRELDVKKRIVSLAVDLGFDIVRITTADPFLEDSATAIDSIRKGYMEGMSWYNENRIARAGDPKKLLPGAKSSKSLLGMAQDAQRTNDDHDGNVGGNGSSRHA